MAKPDKSSPTRLPAGDPVFGRNLRFLRKHHNLTQTQLAELAGVTKGAISQYEKGLNVPGFEVMRRLGEKLECGVDALLYGPNNRYRSRPLPGMAIDDRVNSLPEAMREFVLLALERAERAVDHVPAQFLNPPTSEKWAQFAEYLESITVKSRKENDD